MEVIESSSTGVGGDGQHRPPSSSSVLGITSSSNRNMREPYSNVAVALIFSVPALGGSLFGYDIGATSYVITQLQSKSFSGVDWWQTVADSPALQGVIVSAASAGALLGSIGIFNLADWIGRRKELQYGAMLYIAGVAFEVFSGHNPAWSAGWALTLLISGRLVYGVGIGVTMHAAPTYLAEMGPSSIRGLLISMKEASIVLGILLGYVVGFGFSTTLAGWRWTYACSLVLSSTMLILSFVIPKSTRWLMLVKRDDEAIESLKFVYSKAHRYAEEEYARMKQLYQSGMSASTMTTTTTVLEEEDGIIQDMSRSAADKKSIWDPTYRAPLVAGLGLVILQQITGQPSILSYAAPIFQDAGLCDYASILVAAFKLVATLSAASTVEKFGRKPLLYSGISLMLVALIALSIMFGMQGGAVETIILVAMFLYIGGYQFSFGPISWLIVGEVFPLDVRGQAVSLSGQTNFFLNAVVQLAVPVLQSMIGLNALFAMFAVLTAYSLYFVRVYVPETRGLSLEQIERKFEEMGRRARTDMAQAMEAESIPLVDA